MIESCTCAKCVNACKCNPGLMMPNEAEAAIDAGYASSLMLNWYDLLHAIYILCPASIGYEGHRAPSLRQMHHDDGIYCGRCVFLNDHNRCMIHNTQFKPYVCRKSMVCTDKPNVADTLMREVAEAWDNDEAKTLIARWKGIVKFGNSIEKEEDFDTITIMDYLMTQRSFEINEEVRPLCDGKKLIIPHMKCKVQPFVEDEI